MTRRRQRTVVRDLDDVADELVAVTRHRANELRRLRPVAQRAPDRANGLGEVAIGDDDIGPDAIEDLLARDRTLALADEQHQQIEVLRDESHRTPVLEEHTGPRREDERTEREADEQNANRRLRRFRRWTTSSGSRQ